MAASSEARRRCRCAARGRRCSPLRSKPVSRRSTRNRASGPIPIRTTAARLDGLARRTFESLRDAHVADYRALFGRVALDLGSGPQDALATDRRLREYAAGAVDPGLEALYYQYGRYLLISASRPGGPPANLQGIWNPHLRPPWSSNYTVNINTEMNYWPAETTNLAECHQPLLRFIGDLAKTGAVTARHFYGCGGLVRAPQQRHLGHQQSRRRSRPGQSGVGQLADVRPVVQPAPVGALRVRRRQGVAAVDGVSADEGRRRVRPRLARGGPGRLPRHRAVHVAREPVQDTRRLCRGRVGDDNGGPRAGARRAPERGAGVGDCWAWTRRSARR